MARPIRVEFPDAIYHLMARGNGRAAVFENDRDRRFFLRLLARVRDRYRLDVHAYCLMSNHYHLLAQSRLANLSRAMQHLNGLYGQWFARERDRPGHVWSGRYKAKLVQTDDYFLAVSRYIVLNPVAAKLAEKASAYPWSSYRATVGEVEPPPFLLRDFTLGILDVNSARAVDAYRQLTGVLPRGAAPHPSKFATPEFLARLTELVTWRTHREATISERHPARPPVRDLVPADLPRGEWETVARRAREEHGYSLSQIAAALGCHPSTLSRMLQRPRV